MRELISTYRNLIGLSEAPISNDERELYYKTHRAMRDSDTAHEASRNIRSTRDHVQAMNAHTAAADSHEQAALHAGKVASAQGRGFYSPRYHSAMAKHHQELAQLHAEHGGE